METEKVFENGRNRTVRLSRKFRFSEDEAVVQQLGEAMAPREKLLKTFMDGLNSFTSDIFENGRNQGIQGERESL